MELVIKIKIRTHSQGEKMSKRLGGIIGCNCKTSSWHLNGFPYGSMLLIHRLSYGPALTRYTEERASVCQSDLSRSHNLLV